MPEHVWAPAAEPAAVLITAARAQREVVTWGSDGAQWHSVADLLGRDVPEVVHHLRDALWPDLLVCAQQSEPCTSPHANTPSDAQEGELRIAHARRGRQPAT